MPKKVFIINYIPSISTVNELNTGQCILAKMRVETIGSRGAWSINQSVLSDSFINS